MLDYTKLSAKQMTELTEDQIEKIEQFLCMQEGLPLQSPTVPPQFNKKEYLAVEPELSRWCLLVNNSVEMMAETYEDLEPAMKCKGTRVSANYVGDTYCYYPINVAANFSIERRQVYSQDAVALIKEREKEVKQAEKDAKNAQEDYENLVASRRETLAPFRLALADARQAKREINKIRDCFVEYLALAGDPAVALKFLQKAYNKTVIERAVSWGLPEFAPIVDLVGAWGVTAEVEDDSEKDFHPTPEDDIEF